MDTVVKTDRSSDFRRIENDAQLRGRGGLLIDCLMRNIVNAIGVNSAFIDFFDETGFEMVFNSCDVLFPCRWSTSKTLVLAYKTTIRQLLIVCQRWMRGFPRKLNIKKTVNKLRRLIKVVKNTSIELVVPFWIMIVSDTYSLDDDHPKTRTSSAHCWNSFCFCVRHKMDF
uniref:RNA-directed DNA polymerase, eukaryota, reverse transcriptase zinc-binding domain protein n=1 Tax=Haemonchus placei TaxID=6290 RepID=A0A0N4X8N7_HAEPC